VVLGLSHVSKAFGSVVALRDVSIALSPGQVHAVAGENGAGKSTLIKTLAGVHRPDSVFVLVGGDLTHTTGLLVPVDAGVAAAFLR
jgi:rhamnose transport system ATP-binding protein